MIERSREPELMDGIRPELIPRSTFRFLSAFNRFGGGDAGTLDCLMRLRPAREAERGPGDAGRRSARSPFLLLDLGAGDGAMTRRLARALEKEGRVLPVALDRRTRRAVDGVHFVVADATRLPFRAGGFDVVVSSLLLHHLDDDAIAMTLAESRRVARSGVIANDLVRSRFAFAVTWIVTRLLGDRLVRHDGPLSIRRALTCEEISGWMAKHPGWAWRLERRAFFRFLLTILPDTPRRRPAAGSDTG